MNADEKQVIDDIANAMQTIGLLATRLRRDLGESAQQATDLEGASDRIMLALRRLQPPPKQR